MKTPKVIYKYILSSECFREIPIGASLLSVHEQDGEICLWALVDPANNLEVRHFSAYRTGEQVPQEVTQVFIGTVPLKSRLWEKHTIHHVFERKGLTK